MNKNRLIPVFSLFVWVFNLATAQRVPAVFVQNYTVGDYKASCQNWGLSASNEGVLYVANNSGLLTFDGNSWQIHELPGQPAVSRVTVSEKAVYTFNAGQANVWTRNSYGLLHSEASNDFPPDSKEESLQTSLPFVFAHEPITATAQIESYYFVGTAREGLFMTDSTGTVLLHLTANNLLQDNQIHDLLVQKDGRLWIAMDNGLALLKLHPPIYLLGERSLTGKPEQAFLKDGTIYLKSNSGYFKRSLSPDDSFSRLSEKEAKKLFPPSNTAHKPQLELADNAGDLGVFNGTNRIYPISENSFWLVQKNEAGLFFRENKTLHLKCRILFDNYNLNLVNRGKSFIPLNDTLHLVSTMQGVVLLNSRKILVEGVTSQALPRLTGIEYTCNERNTHYLPTDSRKLSLPHNFRELILHAGTSIFTLNQPISYCVEGISPDWSAWQKNGRVALLQLPPGKYTVRIRTYTIRGPFPETDIDLQVRPPWYQTWWAKLFYALIVLFAAWGMTFLYLKNQRKKEKERLLAERAAEQRRLQQLKNEMLETELQTINDELTRQTSTHVRKNNLMQSLLKELEEQKKTAGEHFPDKMYKKLSSAIEKNLNDQEDWNAFETYFNRAHRDFTERLCQAYPDITPGDQRVCCLLRMNLSTKEIASLLNISIRAVELRRYRLRKRMSLENNTNLTEFLMQF
ncbi:MAG: transcriptional regulator [Massilibacteroides sp.]|nr:transcriptional regulator [Massilibacteroides sp.]MDD3061785.1 transcriptional regulator [Massilibacteroides sp.]MDD4660429.1 transcriptional regulator [Massilibacteroides sp.]